MLRGHPDLILDSCSVRAKRGGDLTGPNSTDRAKKGSKYHVATTGDGLPVACAVPRGSAAAPPLTDAGGEQAPRPQRPARSTGRGVVGLTRVL